MIHFCLCYLKVNLILLNSHEFVFIMGCCFFTSWLVCWSCRKDGEGGGKARAGRRAWRRLLRQSERPDRRRAGRPRPQQQVGAVAAHRQLRFRKCLTSLCSTDPPALVWVLWPTVKQVNAQTGRWTFDSRLRPVYRWCCAANSMKSSIPAGPSGDCAPLRRIKTEPPEGEIIQITVPGEFLEVLIQQFCKTETSVWEKCIQKRV